MPLHAWLRSVVKDAGSLSHIEELLGLEEVKGSGAEE
jgi:type VI secretion system protein ImpA